MIALKRRRFLFVSTPKNEEVKNEMGNLSKDRLAPEPDAAGTYIQPRAEAWANLDELTKNTAKNNPLLYFVELLIEVDEKNKRRERIERLKHEYRNIRSESA